MVVTATGTTVVFCERCTRCTGFKPGPTPLRERRRQAAAEQLIDEAAWPAPTLILAWNSWWCETCSARTWVEGAACHGELMTPVRLEMHSRDSPG